VAMRSLSCDSSAKWCFGRLAGALPRAVVSRPVRAGSLLAILASSVLVLSGCAEKVAPPDGKKTDDAGEKTITGELTLFHAGSLAVPLREASEEFQKRHPGVTVKAEAAGSRDSARKICDLGRPCDVLAAADYKVVEELLMPAHADYNIRFATNEMAIAYTARSKLADQVNAKNWHQIVLRPDVAFGRADPNRDPCGYRTVMLFQLAEKHYKAPGLADKLLAKDERFVRPKETDLLALLESGEIDYLFIYRSVIQQHKLSMVALPGEVSLKSPALEKLYQTATVQVTGKKPGELVTQKGEAIVYSVTIPRNAPNAAAAQAYVALLLSPEGRTVMRRNGQEPIEPAEVDRRDKLPETLKPMCRQVDQP